MGGARGVAGERGARFQRRRREVGGGGRWRWRKKVGARRTR